MRTDLIRIDETGAAHPLGKTASRRMRSRRGTFRLLPSPLFVVLMGYVGEDGVREGHDGAVVRLAGETARAMF